MTTPTSDAAVKGKTGKTWAQWFSILDAAGCASMTHKQIVAVLANHDTVDAWWQQSITVGYERVRGLRQKHETTGGFEASVSRTIKVPLTRLYEAWKDGRARARWLKTPGLKLRTAAPDKSMRFDWPDGTSRLDVYFYARGDNKSQVTVQHNKLPDAAAVKAQKEFWAGALDALKAKLED